MDILNKGEIHAHLYKYYIENYRELETDKWYEQLAANVWLFERNGKLITLKCHILTGKVEAQEESLEL